MILNALVERLKRLSKDDFKGRHFEASLSHRQLGCWPACGSGAGRVAGVI